MSFRFSRVSTSRRKMLRGDSGDSLSTIARNLPLRDQARPQTCLASCLMLNHAGFVDHAHTAFAKLSDDLVVLYPLSDHRGSP